MPNIITTCCPSVNDLIEKYYPDCAEMMAPVVSPMVAHGRYIKKIYGPDVKVVFLGPCIAKKQEAAGDERVTGAIDGILTFEELAVWLNEAGIDIHACTDKPMGNPDPKINRLYPVSGGVIQSVITEEEADGYHKVFVDGWRTVWRCWSASGRESWITALSRRMSVKAAARKALLLPTGIHHM